MRCTICGDDNCTSLRHSFKSDPHYERLRDPRNKRIEQLEAAIEYCLGKLKHHHMTKPGISALVDETERRLSPNEKLTDAGPDAPGLA